MGGIPNQLIVCMLSESWYGGYQLATVWRAVGHGGYMSMYQVSSVGNVRVEGHGGGASKELEYEPTIIVREGEGVCCESSLIGPLAWVEILYV